MMIVEEISQEGLYLGRENKTRDKKKRCLSQTTKLLEWNIAVEIESNIYQLKRAICDTNFMPFIGWLTIKST